MDAESLGLFSPLVISGLCTNSSAVCCVVSPMTLELGKNLFVPSFVLRNLENYAWSGLDGCVVMSLRWSEWLGCLQRLRWPAPIISDSYIGPRPGNEITCGGSLLWIFS
jgi:hypothetical protein